MQWDSDSTCYIWQITLEVDLPNPMCQSQRRLFFWLQNSLVIVLQVYRTGVLLHYSRRNKEQNYQLRNGHGTSHHLRTSKSVPERMAMHRSFDTISAWLICKTGGKCLSKMTSACLAIFWKLHSRPPVSFEALKFALCTTINGIFLKKIIFDLYSVQPWSGREAV
jgi:hypothetical protein